jgi:hypothetical protein
LSAWLQSSKSLEESNHRPSPLPVRRGCKAMLQQMRNGNAEQSKDSASATCAMWGRMRTSSANIVVPREQVHSSETDLPQINAKNHNGGIPLLVDCRRSLVCGLIRCSGVGQTPSRADAQANGCIEQAQQGESNAPVAGRRSGQ